MKPSAQSNADAPRASSQDAPCLGVADASTGEAHTRCLPPGPEHASNSRARVPTQPRGRITASRREPAKLPPGLAVPSNNSDANSINLLACPTSSVESRAPGAERASNSSNSSTGQRKPLATVTTVANSTTVTAMPLALSSVADVELPYLGQWLPAPQPGEDERCLLANTDASQTELELAAVSARGGSIELALAAALADILITAAVDSGCSGSLTWNAKWLVNVRPCSEKFRAADGTIARATCIGDMPVVPRDEAGRPVRITFRNVRCVPAFKFTLLSVTQLWEEQRIDARFADVRSLVLPAAAGGRRIPFTPGGRLPTLTVVSDLPSRSESSSVSGHPASASPPASPPPANELPAEQALPAELLLQVLAALAADDAPAAAALAADEPARALGFHRVGATAHIGRLSAPQAAEILHRRSHLGVDKLRALAHTTVDAPKVLASATATARTTSCTSCAAARIRRGAHSGTLSAPAPEPGVLHIDLKELVLSIGGYRYVVFAIDEHARYVFVRIPQAQVRGRRAPPSALSPRSKRSSAPRSTRKAARCRGPGCARYTRTAKASSCPPTSASSAPRLSSTTRRALRTTTTSTPSPSASSA